MGEDAETHFNVHFFGLVFFLVGRMRIGSSGMSREILMMPGHTLGRASPAPSSMFPSKLSKNCFNKIYLLCLIWCLFEIGLARTLAFKAESFYAFANVQKNNGNLSFCPYNHLFNRRIDLSQISINVTNLISQPSAS